MNILEELYRGHIVFSGRPYPQNAEFAEAVSLRERNLEKLMEKLDGEGKEIFEKYLDMQGDVERGLLYDMFVHTLKLGVLLMAEVFTGR